MEKISDNWPFRSKGIEEIRQTLQKLVKQHSAL